MIALQVQNDPNNAAEWIFFACIIAKRMCTEAGRKHTHTQHNKSKNHLDAEKDITTQRGGLQSLFFPVQQRLMAAFRISTHH